MKSMMKKMLIAPLFVAAAVVALSFSAYAYTWGLDAAVHVTSGYPGDQAVSEDFNHDGYPDIAFVSKSVNNVSVVLGKPPALMSWSVGAAESYPTGDLQSWPRYIASGDFDDDGNSDLVISNYYLTNSPKSSISVAMGDGAGAFGAYTTFLTGILPEDVGVADFDGDGMDDVIVVCNGGNDSGLYVHINTGGSFKAVPDADVVYTRLDTNVEGLALGDFDMDGTLDAATVYHDQNEAGTPFRIAVMLGDGTGGFVKNDEMAVGDDVTHLACGDINHDGKLDLAAPSPTDNMVSVFLGNGDGTFVAGTVIPLADAHYAAIADMDIDGNPDLVIATPDIAVLTGNGDGSFNTAQYYSSSFVGSPYVLISDLNRDGLPDVITDSSFGDGFEVLTGAITAYHLTTAASPDIDGNSVSPASGDYDPGTVVDLTATPGADYHFINWTGDTVADDSSAATTVTMDSDKSVTANFVKHGIETAMTEDGRYMNVSAVYYVNGGPAPDGTPLVINYRVRANDTLPWPDKWKKKNATVVAGGGGGATFAPLKVKNGEYQIRVAYAPKGVIPEYSAATDWTVSTVVLITYPGKTTPDQSPAVTWQAVPGAIGYHIQTSAVKTFTPLTDSVYLPGGATTSGNIPALTPGVSTLWRVVPVLSDGVSTAIPNKPKKTVYNPAP